MLPAALDAFPFSQAVRECSIAKRMAQPAAPELDAEVARYEEAVVALNKELTDAREYYASKSYEQDDFKRGKELHQELVKAFGTLDERVDALGTAVETWRKQLPPPPDELDSAALLGEKAMAEARALTLLFVAKTEPAVADAHAAAERLLAAIAALSGAGESDTAATYAKTLTPALRELYEAAGRAEQALAKKALLRKDVHELGLKYAAAVEGSQRALAKVVGGTGKLRVAPGAAKLGPDRPSPGAPIGAGAKDTAAPKQP